MDKKIAGILGAVATLGSFTAAEAGPAPAPADVLRADSYADLLEPIPNAVALLQAVDRSTPAQTTENVQLAQFYHTITTIIITIASIGIITATIRA